MNLSRYALKLGVLAASILLAGCDRPQWQGWVYPAASDLTDDIPIGRFESLDQCRASAKAVLNRTEESMNEDGDTIRGDYECGFKCKPDGGLGGLNLCEKTER